MQQKVVLFWFRRDLRLDDNAGLHAALSSRLPVVPIFIFDKEILSALEDKDDKRVTFIYAALEQLQTEVAQHKSTFDVRYGTPMAVFKKLLNDYDVEAVYTNHDYEPYATQRDKEIEAILLAKGISFFTTKDQVIFEKDEVTKDDGKPYSIYTPFSKKWKTRLKPENLKLYPSQRLLSKLYQQSPISFPSLSKMGFVHNEGISIVPSVSQSIIKHYHQTRNIPSVLGTSRLGIHLRFGTVSIRKLAAKALELNGIFLNELIWREFFMQMLWHQPRVVTEACKKEYNNIKWRNNEEEFKRWCNGETGYPIVDAGMRELNETGFMHNRVRMVAGSFLVKDLLVDWRWGEAYFARKLLDFELSSNNGNWQWVAGCGCDAAPYFRVFNPTIQAKKFDPKSEYIRKWVPEYGTASYPKPMVDHDEAKQRCIKAYKTALYKTKE